MAFNDHDLMTPCVAVVMGDQIDPGGRSDLSRPVCVRHIPPFCDAGIHYYAPGIE